MTEIRNFTEQTTLDYDNFIIIQKSDGATRKMSLYTLLGVAQPLTSLSLDFEGADGSTFFTDSSPANRISTVFGNAQLTTTLPILGTSSGLFDGIGDYITFPSSPDFAFGSGNGSISFWIKTSQVGSFKCLLARDNGAFNNGSWAFLNNNGLMQLWWGDFSSTTAFMVMPSGSISDGTQHKIEWIKSGNNHSLVVDSNVVATATTTTAMPDVGTSLAIGNDLNFSGRNYAGLIDGLLIIKG